jgi:hypothetical protein
MTLRPPFKLFRGVPPNLLADRGTRVKNHSSKLTTCDVRQDGSTIALGLLDHSGRPVTLELPLEQAEAVAVTLPHLLSQAVKKKTGNDKSRYVFKVDEWAIETVEDHDSLVVTLTTGNGFSVSFDFSYAACQCIIGDFEEGLEKATTGERRANPRRRPN